MKLQNLLAFAPVLLLSLNLSAQGPGSGVGSTQWKTNGNIADENHFIGTKNEFPVKFRSNDIERLRISPDGKIGINTSTPESRLDVNGDVILRSSLKLNGLGISNGLDKDILLVDGNGQVTKGANAVLGDIIYQPKLCLDGPISNPTWQHGVNKIYTPCPQVNVGISNSSPRVSLDVTGTTYSQNLALGADPINMDLVRLKIRGYGLSSNANLIEINNNANQLLTISNQGDLNLNGKITLTSLSNNPLVIENESEKILQVESDGLLRARRVKIDQNTWADYVFDENFNLMPIYEVEEYISENHHLPDMPSTEEVNENGVEIAEMNALLLKKIEELMLYTIDQQKEIDLLKEEIQKLKVK